MHLASELWSRSSIKPRSLRSPHRSSSEGAGGGGRRRHDQCFEPRNVSARRNKEAERRRTLIRIPPHLAVRLALCKGRSPIGVPPRLSPKGVIVPKAHLGPGFVRRASRGGFAADASPHSQRAPCAPVIVPAGLIPETPGSESDEPPPAGTASRSAQPGSPADVLQAERNWTPLLKSNTRCQKIFYLFKQIVDLRGASF